MHEQYEQDTQAKWASNTGAALGANTPQGWLQERAEAQIKDRAGFDYSSPVAKAEVVIKEANEHDRLAQENRTLLGAIMPSWQASMRQLSTSLFSWFRHQGFWREDSGPNRTTTSHITIPREEYDRLKKAEKIALIHSELSEMLEAVRKNDYCNESEEWADVLVRLMDYNGGFNTRGELAFEQKMHANFSRPHRHNKEF